MSEHASPLQTAAAPSTAQPSVDSGKGAADENFPVGSWLIAPQLRPAIAGFYRFARTADDIADTNRLTSAEKIARLDAMQTALLDPEETDVDSSWVTRAAVLRETLNERRVTQQHALDLLTAFKQDAVKSRYQSWAELRDYCALSASPVGRFLLDLHGEAREAWEASDALCNALQVLNHLQDCAADLRSLDRVYLPLEFLAASGSGIEALRAPATSPALRAVFDRCLDLTDEWIALAASLPPRLRSRRLAMESSIIVALAKRLSARLRRGDPLAARVALSKFDFARAGFGGLFAGALHRAQARNDLRPAVDR